jgi:hypothetical protein
MHKYSFVLLMLDAFFFFFCAWLSDPQTAAFDPIISSAFPAADG